MRVRLFITGGVLLLATLMTATGLVVAGTTMAQAAVPPFDPAGNGATQGVLSLYNGSGTKITSGSLANPPEYALATSDTGRNGDSLASLYAATPQEGVNPLQWPNDLISVPSEYPSSSAPGVLQNNAKALASSIFLWLDPSDPDSYAGNFPNTNSTASWKNLYQLRLFTSGSGQPIDPDRYSSATISVNTTTDTWTQVYPDAASSAPVVTSPATISGTARVGYTLTCSAEFSGATSTSFVWQRNGNNITGATANTYKLTAADLSKSIRCRATGTNANGSTNTTSAEVIVRPGDALVNTTKPTISGTPRPGRTLTVDPGAWDPNAASYKFQWLRNGNAITGEKSKNYNVHNTDVGKKLSCKVTAVKAGYTNGVAKTAAVTVTN